MNQQLLNKIAKIRRRAWLLVWLRALLGTAAALLVGLLIIGVLDWWLRPESFLGRNVLFGGGWLVVTVAVYRWIWPALRWRPGKVELARRIEHALPELRDRLSTSVEIAETNQRDGRDNSPVEENLISSVHQQLQTAAPRSIASMSFIRRSVLAALIAGSLFALLWWWQPANVSLGLKRLSQPWSQFHWPRRNSLVFLVQPPNRVSPGDSLKLLVRDRNGGPLHDARLEVQLLDGRGESSFLEPELSRGAPDIFHFRLDGLEDSLRLRAVGGDSRTRWFEIDVLDLPRIIDLDVKVQSVDQARPVTRTIEDPIRCPPGSKLIISGATNVPVARAELVLRNDADTWRWPATDQRAQETFSLDVDIVEAFDAAELWIELESLDGAILADRRRWELQLTLDRPPLARVNQETLETDVGVASVIPIEFEFQDEDQISAAAWQLSRSDDQSEIEFPLFPTLASEDPDEMTRTFVASDELAVNQLPDVKVGDQFTITPSCVDSSGQRSDPAPVTVEVVSRESLVAGLLVRQSRVLQRLDELITQQSELASQSGQLSQLEDNPAGWSRKARNVINRQHNINRRVMDDHRGSLALTRQLVEFARRHGLDWPGRAKLDAAVATQQAIIDGVMPQLGERMQQLDTSLRITEQPGSTNFNQLKSSIPLQQEVARLLQTAADNLRAEVNLQSLINSARRLRTEQSRVRVGTASLARVRLETGRLDEEQLRELVRGQQQVQTDAERFASLLRQALDSASRDNEPLATRFRDCIELINREAMFNMLAQIQSQLANGRLGPAQEGQQRVGDVLTQVIDSLAPPEDDTTETTDQANANQLQQGLNQAIDDLQNIDNSVNDLADAQADLSTAEQSSRRAALDRSKRAISDRLRQMRDAMQNLPAAADAAQQVGEAIQGIEASPGSLDPQELTQESDQLQSALQRLQRAALSLGIPTDQTPESDIDLNQTMQVLRQLVQAQRAISERLFNRIKQRETWTAQQEREVLELQQEAAAQFDLASGPLARFQTAALLRAAVITDYLQVLQRMEQSNFDERSLYLSDRVVSGVEQLADAVAIQLLATRDNSEMQSEDESSQQGNESGSGISSFELTMLYVMQRNLHDQALNLEQKIAANAGRESADLQQMRLDLATAQQQLADTTGMLLQSIQQGPDANEIPPIPDF